MNDFIRGAAPPSGAGPPVYDVIAPQAGEMFDLTVLGDFVLGTACHWVIDPATRKGRSHKCYKDEGKCDSCGKHRNLWLGWIAAYEHLRKRKSVLRLGSDSVKHFGTVIGRSGKPRGRRLEVGRAKDGRTSALTFYDAGREPLEPLPPAPDIRPTVCLVLGCDFVDDTTFSLRELRERPSDVPLA